MAIYTEDTVLFSLPFHGGHFFIIFKCFTMEKGCERQEGIVKLDSKSWRGNCFFFYPQSISKGRDPAFFLPPAKLFSVPRDCSFFTKIELN